MPCAAVVLVDPGLAGNIGGTIRVAANFGVDCVHLVRPSQDPTSEEVLAWACGGEKRLKINCFESFDEAVSGFRCLIATASARGRENLPIVDPPVATREIRRRGLKETALVFGNETSGLRREDLDRCDLVVRIPTVDVFPVLNLAQSVGIMLVHLAHLVEVEIPESPTPAQQDEVDQLMAHLEESLSVIGFLDPSNPARILRKLRRLFGRAGITQNEVDIVRGICRQMQWAARTTPAERTRFLEQDGQAVDDGNGSE